MLAQDKKILPLADRVLVERSESEEKTPGGIIIPDSSKEKPAEGTVVAVGSGKLNNNGVRVPLAVEVGQKVLFGKWSGTEVKINGKELILLKEDDILAIIQ